MQDQQNQPTTIVPVPAPIAETIKPFEQDQDLSQNLTQDVNKTVNKNLNQELNQDSKQESRPPPINYAIYTCVSCKQQVKCPPDGKLRMCPCDKMGVDHTKWYTRILGESIELQELQDSQQNNPSASSTSSTSSTSTIKVPSV